MPTPTTRNGFRKPDPGADNNTWGALLNSAVFDLEDDSLDGWVEVSASGTTTLTATQYVANQARMRVIHYSAATPGTVVIPSVQKWYLVYAESAAVTISNGGSTAIVPAGNVSIVITDGADIILFDSRIVSGDLDMNGFKAINAGSPTNTTDLVTKAYADALAFAGTVPAFPALPGNAGRPLVVNSTETSVGWDTGPLPKTANFTAVRGGSYSVDTRTGVVTCTAPGSLANGDVLSFADGGNTATDAGWAGNRFIFDPGVNTVMGSSGVMNCRVRGASFSLSYQSGDWKFV